MTPPKDHDPDFLATARAILESRTFINELGGDGTTSGTAGPSAMLHHQVDQHMKAHGHTAGSDGGWSGSSGAMFHHKGALHSPGTSKTRTMGVDAFHKGLHKLGFHSHEKHGSGQDTQHTWEHDSGHTLHSFHDGGSHHRYTHLDHHKNGRVDPSRVTHANDHTKEMEELRKHHHARAAHHDSKINRSAEGDKSANDAHVVANKLHHTTADHFGYAHSWYKSGKNEAGDGYKKQAHMFAKLTHAHEKEHGLDEES